MISPFTGFPVQEKQLTNNDKTALLDDDKWVFDLASKLNIPGAAGGGGPFDLADHTTDELPEGSTNLYSQWEMNTYGAYDYLQAKDTTQGLVIGNDLHSSVTTAFAGASALFNGDVAGSNNGQNYFLNLAYGTSYAGFGGVFAGGHANGTSSAPTQTLTSDWLGGVFFAGFDGTDWALSTSDHSLTGLWSMATSDVASGVKEEKLYFGGLITPMIALDTSDNSIKLNESLFDSDITAYYSGGSALAIDGATGNIGIGTASPSARLHINGTANDQQLIVRGHSTQTANLQEWQSSSGTVLAYISPTGILEASTIRATTDVTVGIAGVIRDYYQTSYLLSRTANPRNLLKTNAAGATALVLQGAAAQTANLQEWQNSGGTVLGGVTSDGRAFFNRSSAAAITGGGSPGLTVGANDGVALQIIMTATSGSNSGAGIVGYSNDGAANASGDRLAYFLGGGMINASTAVNSAGITIFASEAYGSSNQGGEIRFETTPNGSTVSSRVMRVKVPNNVDGFEFGAASDTNLYRSAANILKTDDSLVVGTDLEIDGALDHDGTTAGLYGVTPVTRATTGIAEATFTENAGGTAVNVDSTFGGYTLQQVVQALQDIGILT